MSESPELSDEERFPRRESEEAHEKSQFAQICSLQSQYLKQKKKTSDVNPGMVENSEAKHKSETMNLLPNMENGGLPLDLNSLDFFPPMEIVRSLNPPEDAVNKSDLRKPAISETGSAQMTIFYAGKVMVYNDFPADKIREIMAIASKGSNIPNPMQIMPKFLLNSNLKPISPSSPNLLPIISNSSGSNIDLSTQDCLETPSAQVMCPSDMPIKRRNSLQRFLQKRKDRCNARAPYEVVNKPSSPFSKESNSKAYMETQCPMATVKPPF